MKTHKVTKNKKPSTPAFQPIGTPVPAYYTGTHPYLLNSMGLAVYEESQKSWVYKPETIHTEWYRVKLENLTFEKQHLRDDSGVTN